MKNMKTDSQKILLSPVFLIGLFLLLLNDFYLKAEFHNFLTGKISDFAGLFIFPLFFAAFFPKRQSAIYISTGILFIFWKSPFSQSLIEFWNSFEILRIDRIIDVSDLAALSILPVSYKFFLHNRQKESAVFQSFLFKRLASIVVVLISVFAFTATSLKDERNVRIDKKYEFEMSLEQFESLVKNTKSFDIINFANVNETSPNGNYSNSNPYPKKYSVYFDLNKGYCDSKKLRIYIGFEVKDKILVDYSSISYLCKNPPIDNDKESLISIFESEVIEKLRQNSSQ